MEPKVIRQRPSATFKFEVDELAWITRRAAQLGMNKTEFVRWLLRRDMDNPAPRDEKARAA